MGLTRDQYAKDKAMVVSITGIQKLPAVIRPKAKAASMCRTLRAGTSPEYLASLAFHVEMTEGEVVALFADLDADFATWGQIDMEFGIDFDTALARMKESYTREKELAASGAQDGSNVIDFNAYRIRRGLLAA